MIQQRGCYDRLRQNGRHFADDIFKCVFINENVWIVIKISLNFVPKGRINNIPALVQIMAWRLRGDKPLCEPMMVSLLTNICVTWPQWVNASKHWAGSTHRSDIVFWVFKCMKSYSHLELKKRIRTNPAQWLNDRLLMHIDRLYINQNVSYSRPYPPHSIPIQELFLGV